MNPSLCSPTFCRLPQATIRRRGTDFALWASAIAHEFALTPR